MPGLDGSIAKGILGYVDPVLTRTPTNTRKLCMKKVLGGLLVLLVLTSSLIVFIPVYLIRPFVPQTASDLEFRMPCVA